MSGSFGEMGNLLKQAQQMQREVDRVRKELRETTLEGTAGGGAVRVEVDGDGQLIKVQIAQEVIDGRDRAVTEDLVLAATRDAISKAAALREKEMSKVTSGLNLPGIF